jgi:hypothetical protein
MKKKFVGFELTERFLAYDHTSGSLVSFRAPKEQKLRTDRYGGTEEEHSAKKAAFFGGDLSSVTVDPACTHTELNAIWRVRFNSAEEMGKFINDRALEKSPGGQGHFENMDVMVDGKGQITLQFKDKIKITNKPSIAQKQQGKPSRIVVEVP